MFRMKPFQATACNIRPPCFALVKNAVVEMRSPFWLHDPIAFQYGFSAVPPTRPAEIIYRHFRPECSPGCCQTMDDHGVISRIVYQDTACWKADGLQFFFRALVHVAPNPNNRGQKCPRSYQKCSDVHKFPVPLVGVSVGAYSLPEGRESNNDGGQR